MLKYILALLLMTSLYAGDGDVVQSEALPIPETFNTTATYSADDANFTEDIVVRHDKNDGYCQIVGTIQKAATAAGTASAFEFTIDTITVDETRMPVVGAIERIAIGSARQVEMTSSGSFHGIFGYRLTTNRFYIDTPSGTFNYNNIPANAQMTFSGQFPCNVN